MRIEVQCILLDGPQHLYSIHVNSPLSQRRHIHHCDFRLSELNGQRSAADEVALAFRRALRFFPEATQLNLSVLLTRLLRKVFSKNWNTGGILDHFYARLYTLRNLYTAAH